MTAVQLLPEFQWNQMIMPQNQSSRKSLAVKPWKHKE